MSKKYKLIKVYPGCIYDLNTIIEFNGTNYRREGSKTMFFILPSEAENYPEFWKEIKEEPKKEWEILSIKYNNLIYGININKSGFTCERGFIRIEASIWGNIYGPKQNRGGEVNIHSVKRLSDGEVFTIGDTIRCKEVSSHLYMPQTITSIIINDENNICMITNLTNKNGLNINKIEKFNQKIIPYNDGFTPQQMETINKMIDEKLKNYE